RVAVVVTVSPQSRAALAAYFGLSPATCLARLAGWFKWLGVRAVWDLGTARDCVLLEEAAEFVERYRATQAGGAGSSGDAAGSAAGAAASGPLPVMASSCPGWVCYAEKTHGSRVLPHLSSTRSPQGAMGGLVKSLVANAWGVTPGSLYHVTVMPCYDKKLEASRDELTTTVTTVGAVGSSVGAATDDDSMVVDGGDGQQGAAKIPEVDCCLTTGEVLQLLQQRPPPCCDTQAATDTSSSNNSIIGASGSSSSSTNGTGALLLAHPAAPAAAPDPLLPGLGPDAQLYGLQYGSSSGGYADFVFRVAARELCGLEVPPGALPWRTLRNADFQELSLDLTTGASSSSSLSSAANSSTSGQATQGSLRFARVYGFRNIQTLLRQIKMGRCSYHYVEVMACPSGCLNGGGQVKPGPGVTPQQLIEQLEAVYAHSDVAARSPADNPAVVALYGNWLGGRPGSPAARQLLHTTFREREKTVTAATVANW
ncbi:hypothetical protein Agub_g1200, partial [Astrephomene gubernaculifera]